MEGCTYRLNRRDLIVAVDDGWTRFAEEAGDSALLSPRILQRSLWEFVADPRTRMLQGALLRKVRATRVPVVLPFRCDSPTRKRWMEMKISSSSDGGLEIATTLTREEERARLPIPIGSGRGAGAEILNICGWCNAVQFADGPWQEVEDLLRAKPGWPLKGDAVEISHHLCPGCDTKLEAAGG